jgi:hypothetical protein
MMNKNQQVSDITWFTMVFFCLFVALGAARLVFRELEAQPFGGYLVGGTFARPAIGAAAGLLVGIGWRLGWRKMEQVINGPADRLGPVIDKLTDKVANLISQVEALIQSENKIEDRLNEHLRRFNNVESRIEDHEVRIRVQENKDQ